jgi:branched-chain amino acid transport system ATP-binding protein
MKLQAVGIEVMYRGLILVIKGISFELNEGQVVALLGANGAGKTTTLKAISGLITTEEGRVTSGFITLDGQRIENKDPEESSKLGIIQVLEGRRIFEHLTVEQNLMSGAHARSDRTAVKADLEMVYGMFPALKPVRARKCGYCSGGEQQMTAVGRALMARPKILLLDEASLGLAPKTVREIYEVISRINREMKLSIMLVEQNANIALNAAEYAYVMENGRIVKDGPSDELKNNKDIRQFYLGLTEMTDKESGEVKKRSFRDVKHYKRRKRWL